MIIISTLFFIIASMVVYKGISNVLLKKDPNVFTALLFGCYFYYGVIPYFIQLNNNLGTTLNRDYNEFMGNYKMSDVFYYLIVLAFLYVLTSSYSNYKINSPNFNNIIYKKYLKYATFLSITIGVSCSLLYYHSLGGILQALAMAEFNRSFANSMESVMGGMYILFFPAKLIVLTPFLMSLYMAEGYNKKKNIAFIVTAILSLIFYLYDASRSSLVIYLMALSFPYIQKITKTPWTLIIAAGLGGSFMLNVLDTLFIYFANDEFEIENFDLFSIARQFSFPYRNVLYSFEILDTTYLRVGIDLITSFLEFIPGLSFDSTVDPTSAFFGGSDWRLSGGIPNDVITYSIIEFHIVGVLLMPFILGRLVKKIDTALELLRDQARDKKYIVIVKSYLMFLAFFFVTSADFNAVLQGFSLFVFPLILLKSLKSYRTNRIY